MQHKYTSIESNKIYDNRLVKCMYLFVYSEQTPYIAKHVILQSFAWITTAAVFTVGYEVR